SGRVPGGLSSSSAELLVFACALPGRGSNMRRASESGTGIRLLDQILTSPPIRVRPPGPKVSAHRYPARLAYIAIPLGQPPVHRSGTLSPLRCMPIAGRRYDEHRAESAFKSPHEHSAEHATARIYTTTWRSFAMTVTHEPNDPTVESHSH